MVDHEIRHLAGHGDEVVGECSIEQVSVFAIDAFLKQDGANSLRDTAAHLLIDQKRVDDASAIIDSPLPQDLDNPVSQSTST